MKIEIYINDKLVSTVDVDDSGRVDKNQIHEHLLEQDISYVPGDQTRFVLVSDND